MKITNLLVNYVTSTAFLFYRLWKYGILFVAIINNINGINNLVDIGNYLSEIIAMKYSDIKIGS